MRFDERDRKILSILLKGSATPKAQIARQVGLAASAVSDRIRRLEESGIVKNYEARLDAKALGVPLLAFIFVQERKPNDGYDTAGALAQVTGAEEVHKIAGEDCFLVKLRAAGTEELGAVLDREINLIPTVTGVRTTIVLKSVLEGPPLSGMTLDR
ncbi:MAG: Lrp/AsnC family transcriptional regulator [Pseudomonadota bacterium]